MRVGATVALQRSTPAVISNTCYLAGLTHLDGLSQPQRERMLRAEYLAAALQGFLAERMGRLRLSRSQHRCGEAGRRSEGDGVVGSEDSATALQGVLAQGAGRRGLAELGKCDGQDGCRLQGRPVIRTVHPAAAFQ